MIANSQHVLTGTAAARMGLVNHGGQTKTSQLPTRIEQAMLEVLSRPISTSSEREDEMRRKGELRALFVELAPDQAHGLIRRFDSGDDPLAQALRRFIRRRR